MLLWLWRRPAATAPIRPLAWEPLYAAGAALKRTKRHTHKKIKKSKSKTFHRTKKFFNKLTENRRELSLNK